MGANVLVAGLALATYLPSLGNGFAYDDLALLEEHPVVQAGDFGQALTGPYWRIDGTVETLYRPLTLTSLTAEWQLFRGRPLGFHAVNVAVHVLVSLLVLMVALRVLPLVGAILVGAVFAVHPVHVEAVANIAGRPELYAAAAYLGAVLLFLRRPMTSAGRAARILGVSALYGAGLASKEIAVTLPLMLLALAAFEGVVAEVPTGSAPRRSLWGRWWSDVSLWTALGVVLAGYLVFRVYATGSLVGEELPAELYDTTSIERLATALTLWPEYLRLMVFPLDLAMDYGPPLLAAVRSMTGAVLLGATILVAWVGSCLALRVRLPALSLGLAWFLIAVLPMAHLGVHAGVLLAERTLYLPSVGAALAIGAAVCWLVGRSDRRAVWAGAAVVVGLLMVRAVLRVPSWESTYSVMNTLAMEHPESHRAHRARAEGYRQAGMVDDAARAYRAAIDLLPYRYDLLVEAGAFFKETRALAEAEELLGRAAALNPDRSTAWRLLAETHLLQRRGLDAHRAALQGIRADGPRSVLYGYLSESYILKNDLPSAIRARESALVADPTSSIHRERLEVLRTELARRRSGSERP